MSGHCRQVHDLQSFRERILLRAIHLRCARSSELRPVPPRTQANNDCFLPSGCAIAPARHPVRRCGRATGCRAARRLLGIASSNPAAAAPIAIRVARQDASPARNSHPGVTCSPLPPSSVGMSVNSCVPLVWLVTTRVPPSHRAAAGASSCRPRLDALHRCRDLL